MDSHENADFATRAELARRGGEAENALEIARKGLDEAPRHVAGRVAASLALLDLGRVADARAMLEAVVHLPDVRSSTPLADLAEAELEEAFEAATPESEQMVDAQGIAMQAVTSVEQGEPDQGPELPSNAFRTATMAELLERQGDEQGARAIRASLSDAPPADEIRRPADEVGDDGEGGSPKPIVAEAAAAEAPAVSGKRRRIKKLERWLQNLGRSGA